MCLLCLILKYVHVKRGFILAAMLSHLCLGIILPRASVLFFFLYVSSVCSIVIDHCFVSSVYCCHYVLFLLVREYVVWFSLFILFCSNHERLFFFLPSLLTHVVESLDAQPLSYSIPDRPNGC